MKFGVPETTDRMDRAILATLICLSIVLVGITAWAIIDSSIEAQKCQKFHGVYLEGQCLKVQEYKLD